MTPEGERLVLLAGTPWGVADPWIAGYVVKKLRGRLSYDSIHRELEGVTRGIRFCERRGIADLRELACRQHLSDDFLSAFADDCGRRADGAGDIADPAQTYNAFLAFILWLGEQPTAEARDADLVVARKTSLQKRIEEHRPVKSGESTPRTGLTNEQRDLFLRVIIPTAPDNPFKSSAFRNLALMSTAFCHGLRSGELLGLKVEDLSLQRGVGKIHVVLRPNDPDDPRRRPAAQKTAPRGIFISEDLTQLLLQLLEHRGKLEAAHRHPYVFCNAEGDPLGDRGLRKAYAVLGRRHPSLHDLINHQLRHDWNDRFVRLVKEMGWDLERALSAQLHNNGWAPGSTMPERYAKKANEEIAGEFLIEAQKRGLNSSGSRQA